MTKTRRTTSKKARQAREWNRKNHTHFKHLNSRGASKRISKPEWDMRDNINKVEYSAFLIRKRALVVSLVKRSTTTRDMWNRIKDDKELRWIVQGMNGVESVNPMQYLRSFMQVCVDSGDLVCLYERDVNKNSVNHRWRYIRKNNIPMISYYIIKNYKHTICEKCLNTMKKIKNIVGHPPFI